MSELEPVTGSVPPVVDVVVTPATVAVAAGAGSRPAAGMSVWPTTVVVTMAFVVSSGVHVNPIFNGPITSRNVVVSIE